MPIDPAFQRIARRLTTFELVVGDDSLQETDLAPGSFGVAGRSSERFLGFYSREGLRRALRAYGVEDALAALGLGGYEVVVEVRDSFQHRAQALLDGVVDDDHRLIDLVARAQRVRAPVPGGERDAGEPYTVLLVEWLALQNPRGRFTRARPRLPGQRLPGLGLGHTMHNLTQLIAQRLGHDGVLTVPEHFHLAVLYRRLGYRFADQRRGLELEAAERATRRLSLAAAAWAAERGLIRRLGEGPAGEPGAPWVYEPAEMVAPLSKRLCSRLGGRSILRRLVRPHPRQHVVVDLAQLRQSLLDDPVEGLDPDDLEARRTGAGRRSRLDP